MGGGLGPGPATSRTRTTGSAEVERISDDRGGFTKLVDATVGEDDSESKVPMPEYPPTPQPPGFAPTATEVTY